jgi:phytoene dehydrogenase-like protein
MCDRHYGGINYPKGGVGGIARELAHGLVEKGGRIQYKANVSQIVMKDGKAVRFPTLKASNQSLEWLGLISILQVVCSPFSTKLC